MAAAATIGERRSPNAGKSAPAAMLIPTTLQAKANHRFSRMFFVAARARRAAMRNHCGEQHGHHRERAGAFSRAALA